MTNKRTLKERGSDAAVAYLERTGLTVVEVNRKTDHGIIPVLALDDTTLVHVTVRVYKGSSPEPYEPTRATMLKHRQRLLDYMAQTGIDLSMRFDVITILVIAEDRALLRHHRAAYTA